MHPAGDATVSAFGDEIHPDLGVQLDVLERAGIDHVDLRGVNGTNVLELDDDELRAVHAAVRERGIAVSGIGSPIGKVDLRGGVAESATRAAVGHGAETFDEHLDRFRRALSIADRVDADYVRIFSYYTDAPDEHREEVIRRLRRKADLAADAGILLLHENVLGIYGETPARCRDVLSAVDSPFLRAIFDPANFLGAGTPPYPDALLDLVEYVDCVHLKDAVVRDGALEHRIPGEGAIDLVGLLSALADRGFDGYLSLEPHLSIDDPDAGLSGVDAFEHAAAATDRLLQEVW